MVALRIHDRAAFHACLADARGGATELPIDEAARQRVIRDLEWMHSSTRDGRVPSEDDVEHTTLGPLSLALPACPAADVARLQELDYAFRRFRALPAPFVSRVPDVAERRGILQVHYGRRAFDKRCLEPGARLTIGSDARADWMVDSAEGRIAITWHNPVAHVRALTDQPFEIDGRQLWYGELAHGSTLTMGRATLRFFVEAFSDPGPHRDTPLVEAARAHIEEARLNGALFLVLDAARSPRIQLLLEEAVDEHAPLYEGERARGLDTVAPYLVKVSPRSGLSHRWLSEGWGQAWGIALLSRAPSKLVRRALRRLLMVQADTRPHPLYFRFYDPRVLRRFAPLATARQRSELFTDIESFVYEASDESAAELRREDAP